MITLLIFLSLFQGPTTHHRRDPNFNPQTEQVAIFEKDVQLDGTGTAVINFLPDYPYKKAPGCSVFNAEHPEEISFEDQEKSEKLTIHGHAKDWVHVHCSGYVPKKKS